MLRRNKEILMAKKCCITCLVVLLVIIIVLGITVGVLINSTPAKLGFADKKFSYGFSLQDLGVADFKIIDIIKGFAALHKFNDASLITNPYSDATASQETFSLFKNSNILSDHKVNCAEVLTAKVVYDNKYLKIFKDTTLAFILNSAIESDKNSNILNEIIFNVKEISITNKDVPHAKIALKLEKNSYPNDAQKKSILDTIINSIIVIVDFDFDVDNNGLITTKNNELLINNGDKFITAIINYQLGDGLDTLRDKVATLFTTMITNIGVIGNATTDSNKVIQGVPTYGKNGVNTGSISFITYNAQ